MKNKKIKLAVTMGDPAGIGPEICLKLLDYAKDHLPKVEIIIYGEEEILKEESRNLNLLDIDSSQVFNTSGLLKKDHLQKGVVDADYGRAAYGYIKAAVDHALSGVVDGIVTAPINKAALQKANISQIGHTEILSELTQSSKTCMLQYSKEVTASFVTCHCGFSDVPKFLTRERLHDVIELTRNALFKVIGKEPKLIVLGLNPHAGEGGLLGNSEEEKIIIPEISEAKKRGLNISGPLPPDTAFLPKNRKDADAFICMYHDQGHIPLKALAFDEAVNITLGLPIVRTSVDHGTAFDIVGTGQANPGSIIEAVKLAERLCTQHDTGPGR